MRKALQMLDYLWKKALTKLSHNLKKKELQEKNEFSVMNTWMNLYNLLKQSIKLIFNIMINAVIVDTECRFKALNEYLDRFGFNYAINYLKFLLREDLLKHCNDLGTILREGENGDIYPFELYEELQILKSTSLENINDAKQLIQSILENNFHEIYLNLYITIRIMLTIPVSTASAERSFSKLKLIKTYLRRTMSQESLSALSVLSIEAEIAAGVIYDTILKRTSEYRFF